MTQEQRIDEAVECLRSELRYQSPKEAIKTAMESETFDRLDLVDAFEKKYPGLLGIHNEIERVRCEELPCRVVWPHFRRNPNDTWMCN